LLPITTPFDASESIDFEGLQSNIQKWNETGIIGYVILGSTGERVHLDEREFLQVVRAAREQVPQHIRFIVGAGQQSIRGTVQEIQRLSAIGPIDAVLVITPSFYRTSITQATLLDYYHSVGDASPIPIILYSMPALTGITIQSQTVAQLSQHENIIGIKDSSADVDGLRETIKQVGDDFAVMTGNGTVLQPALDAGACGAILAVGCVAPQLCIEVYNAVTTGDSQRAGKLQSHLSPLAAAVTTRFGIGGLKAALELNGYAGGPVRAPLRIADEEALTEIRKCLHDANQATLAEAATPA
jgi:4-hydroxy-2-oxoglutarate aldolase